MQEIAIISDTHAGVRNDSVIFIDMTKKFLDDVFFPEIEKRGIKTIVHLGDLVDRRKYINIQTANRLRRDFLEPIKERGLDFHMILGNHDVYYKNTNGVNSVNEICDSSVFVYKDAEEVVINGTPILFVPWINAENKLRSYEAIEKSNSSICMGHLELQGFEMFKGSICSHGDDRKIFDKFDTVLSGHFHHRSSDGTVTYVGSHGQFTWSDYDDKRGFHIMNLKTKDLTFIENPYKMFSKVWYDDSNKSLDEIMNHDFNDNKSTYVKLVVTNKNNPYWLDKFCSEIEKVGVIDLQIVDDHLNLNLNNQEDIINEAESTIDIFKKSINQANFQNKVRLESFIVDLYNQALTNTR
jgi:DNA repair exonuclease SbcCD nuclease subunit